MTFANERLLHEAVIDRIRDHYRGHAKKTHQSKMTGKGEPDVLACVRGRMVQFECKQPGEKPTPVQYGKMRRWEAAGALVGWGRSVEDLDALLTHLDDPEWRNPQLADGVGAERIDLTSAGAG